MNRIRFHNFLEFYNKNTNTKFTCIGESSTKTFRKFKYIYLNPRASDRFDYNSLCGLF